MSNKLTAEEYLDTQLALGWDYIDIETAETYGDLRAKEAVEKFARECYEIMKVQSMTFNVLPAFEKYCKENGVNL